MKKIGWASVLGMLLIASPAFAQTPSFTMSLGFGSTNAAEVMKLQNFLIGQGFLQGTATGNYLGQTQAAVSAFQASQGITPRSGYFGPLTRAAANQVVSGKQAQARSSGETMVGVTGVSAASTAAAAASNTKVITWQTSGYPANAGVNINLIRKISNTPANYSLVRVLATDTPNDGQEVWTPRKGETGGNLYIEVTCSNARQFPGGCQSGSKLIKVN